MSSVRPGAETLLIGHIPRNLPLLINYKPERASGICWSVPALIHFHLIITVRGENLKVLLRMPLKSVRPIRVHSKKSRPGLGCVPFRPVMSLTILWVLTEQNPIFFFFSLQFIIPCIWGTGIRSGALKPDAAATTDMSFNIVGKGNYFHKIYLVNVSGQFCRTSHRYLKRGRTSVFRSISAYEKKELNSFTWSSVILQSVHLLNGLLQVSGHGNTDKLCNSGTKFQMLQT